MKRGFLNGKKAQSAISLTPAPKPEPEQPKLDTERPGPPRFSYGVVERDEGFDPEKVTFVDTDPTIPEIYYTTLPPVPKNKNYVDFPEGWTECAFSIPTTRMIVSHPDFPSELPVPQSMIAWEIREAPGMGLGIYATRDIPFMHLIIAERPFMITSSLRGRMGRKYNPPPKDREQLNQILLIEGEREARILFERMLPEDQKAFMALANSHLHDGSGPLEGIIRTNGYGFNSLQLPEEKLKGYPFGRYTAVTRTLSRANHSCEHNMARDFDPASFAMCTWAIRDIRKGEALTVAYCDGRAPYAERQEALAPYGFVCECPKCLRERPSKS